jgi:hypothetical protein
MKETDEFPSRSDPRGSRGQAAFIAGAILLSGVIVAGAVLFAGSDKPPASPSPPPQTHSNEVSVPPTSPSAIPTQGTSVTPSPAVWHALDATRVGYKPVWAAYVAVGEFGSLELEHANHALKEMGVEQPFYGDLACEAGALAALGLESGIGVGAYFSNKGEAGAFAEAYGAGAYPPARVVPGCAD